MRSSKSLPKKLLLKKSLPKKVYRYMPVHRLWQVLSTKCLYFMRNSKWEDPFEGFLAKQYCETVGKQYEEAMKDKFFLCCSKIQERDHQWRNYTPNKDGVVVTINVEALKAVRKLIACFSIMYPPRREIVKMLNMLRKIKVYDPVLLSTFLFQKRLAFKDEEEFRFFLLDTTANDDIVPVKIETKKVIESIMFDPRMDKDTYKYHKQFIKDQFGFAKITHSSLYDPDRIFKK